MKVFQSELRFQYKYKEFDSQSDFDKRLRRQIIDLQIRTYKKLVNYSELTPDEFWKLDTWPATEPPTMRDRLINPIGVIISEVALPAYYNYVLSFQELDLSMILSRGWGEVLKDGIDNKSLPESAAPYGWRWRWQNTELCLMAPVSAPWDGKVPDLCLPQIASSG